MLDTLLELDRSLLLFFNQGHTLYWDQVMWIYTGKLVWIPLILSMIYVAFRCGGWREGVWFVLVAGLVALLCDQFSSSVCKPFFERYRPARDPDFSSMVTIVNGYRGGMFGFFSSHAANAAGIVVYTALIFRNKTRSLYFSAISSISGIKHIQGSHHVAQKSITTHSENYA